MNMINFSMMIRDITFWMLPIAMLTFLAMWYFQVPLLAFGLSHDLAYLLLVLFVLVVGLAVYFYTDRQFKALACAQIFKACREGDVRRVQKYLYAGAKVNQPDEQGWTPLEWACLHERKDIVRLLIKKGAEVNTVFDSWKSKREILSNVWKTPLEWACARGHEDIVKRLLAKGADVNQPDEQGRTPLSQAITQGHVGIVKRLLTNGADVNLAGERGRTPLEWACFQKQKDIVKLLLEKGAKVNTFFTLFTLSDYAQLPTPLAWACYNGYEDIVKLLLEKGAKVNQKVGNQCRPPITTPLELACVCGKKKGIVRLLLENGADVNELFTFSAGSPTPPLAWACDNGHEDIVKWLLAKGAKANQAYDRGFTPLLLACRAGYVGIVEQLLRKVKDINSYSDPLFEACCEGHENIVKLLLAEGAEVNILSRSQETPLAFACWKGHEGVVKLLLEEGANVNLAGVNLAGERGETPLHLATKYGHIDIVKWLLAKGADITLTNKEGKTAEQIAPKEKEQAIRDCFQQHKQAVRDRAGKAVRDVGLSASNSTCCDPVGSIVLQYLLGEDDSKQIPQDPDALTSSSYDVKGQGPRISRL